MKLLPRWPKLKYGTRYGVITNATEWRNRNLQGKCYFQGLPVSIENERGSYRQGVSSDGHVWRTFMHYPYGYVRATEGTDGDQVDVYLGPHKDSIKVFIVHQQDPKTKKYDEDKVMLGFRTAKEAKSAYLRQYDSLGFFQSMTIVDMATFKWMLKNKKGMKLKKSQDVKNAPIVPVSDILPEDGSTNFIDIPIDYSTGVLEKAKKIPVGGTTQRKDGVYRKVAPGKFVKVSHPSNITTPVKSLDAVREKMMQNVLTITGNTYERAEVCDSEGREIFAKSGESDNVIFTNEESERLFSDAELFVHNHPIPYGLSLPDIVSAFSLDITEIWSVSPNMRSCLKINKKRRDIDKAEWESRMHDIRKAKYMSLNPRQQYSQFAKQYVYYNIAWINDKVYDNLTTRVNNFVLDFDVADRIHAHMVNQKFADQYDCEYIIEINRDGEWQRVTDPMETIMLEKALGHTLGSGMMTGNTLNPSFTVMKKTKGESKKMAKRKQSVDEKFRRVMGEFKRGTLRSSSGKIVTDRQQALAIAASEAGISYKKSWVITDPKDILKKSCADELKRTGLHKEGHKLVVDPKELRMGIKVEMEHTDDPEVAKEIALDHLHEDSKYYTKLKEIEKSITLRKAKYLRRWRGKDGRWQYEYVQPQKKFKKEPSKKLDTSKFDASSYYVKTNKDVSADHIISEAIKRYPELDEKLKTTESKLKGITPTIDKHRISGEGASAKYTEERIKLHNKIIGHFIDKEKVKNAAPPPGPAVIILGGRGGSGKSWFKGNVYDPDKVILLDSDEIKQMLPEYAGWNAMEVHEESSDILEQIEAIASSLKLNIVIDATLKTPENAVRRVEFYKDNGYSIEAHYMHLPRHMAAERAINRFAGPTGRYVPVSVILGNTKNELSFEQVKELADNWSFRDNSTGANGPKLVTQSFDEGAEPLLKAKKYNPKNSAEDFYDFGRIPNPETYSDNVKEWIKKFNDLSKAKYIRRWKGKDGKWQYQYYEGKGRRPKKEEPKKEKPTPKELSEKDTSKLLKEYRKRGAGEGKEKTIANSQNLDTLLRNSTFAMMSAGRNPEDPEDMKLSDAQIKQRYRDLLADLKDKGYVFTQCKGKYVNPEESVMVMCHDSDRKEMMELGTKYKQDSIVFSQNGRGSLIYTTGDKAGKEEMAGEGYKVVPDADDFYTKMPLGDGSTIKFTINLEEIKKALQFPDMCLLKSDSGNWFLKADQKLIPFVWYMAELEKANGKAPTKKYYSSEEIKARGMRWVTIRGARVLLQGTADGGWVVVGGAGGKLSHLKIDKILEKEEYAAKRKKLEVKRKEETQALTKEEITEAAKKRKKQFKARKEARAAYTEKVTDILGVTPEEIRETITAEEMQAIEDRARSMVETRKATKKMPEAQVEQEVEKQIEKEVEKAVYKQVKNVERDALKTLMNDYMPSDPNAKNTLKQLLDKDKAMEVLSARKQFRKAIKAIGKEGADMPTDLKVGAIFASATNSEIEGIQKEINDQIETAKNIEMYDLLNAQSLAINNHIDQGAISSLNGLVGDVYGVGAVFNTDTVKELGLEAVVRAITIKLQQDGKGDIVKKALEEYTASEREKVVTSALAETKKRMKNADDLRSMARDTDTAEAILSMASANGHALKQITAAQRALGTAVGSLRAAAHMINALEDPPADVVQVDMGTDLARARRRAKAAGLRKGTYSIRTVKRGRGKRLVMEIPKESLNNFFQNVKDHGREMDQITSIKAHKANYGYIPPGIKKDIKLDNSQEAGLHFFREKGRVLLDFEAGIGKTAVGYAAAMEAMANHGAKKILIITPSATRGDFYRQREKFLEKDMQKLVRQSTANTSKAERHKRHLEGEGIHIVSQDSLREDASILKDAGYDMVIADEIHEMTAGTGQAGRYRALKQLEDVPLKMAMSGTNIKNSKKELYRKIDFIDPDHTLGSMAEFEKRYKGLNQGTGIFADAANDAFRKEIGQWAYTQKNQLPINNTVDTMRVPMSSNQRKRYAESERLYRQERDAKRPGASARRDSRNYAILSNGDAQDNAKLDTLVNTMKTKHPEEKAVIHVSRPGVPVKNAMRTAKKRLEAEFGKGTVGTIHGETSPGELTKIKAAFNDPENPLRFIIGTKSLESGHNLQHGGTVTFHLDLPDSAAAFDQRNARVTRKGQDRDTSTYVLSGLNPMDMRFEDLMDIKRKEMSALGNPRDIAAMDDEGFIGLLSKYEREAVSE